MSSPSTQPLSQRHASSLFLVVILILLPLAAIVEKHAPKMWQNRLLWSEFTPEPARHTPVNYTGTFLPPVIKQDLRLTPQDSPVLLTGPTNIPAGVRLTIFPGTRLFANEFASLNIAGELFAIGSEQQPIVFTTNEANVRNRLWNGLTAQSGATINLSQVRIQYASPAISCLQGSHLAADHLTVYTGSMGIFTTSSDCKISDSFISHVRDGLVAINATPQLQNVTIEAIHQNIREF